MTKINKVLFIGSKKIGLRCLQKMWTIDKKSLIGAITYDDSKDKRSVLKHFINFADKNRIRLFIIKNKFELDLMVNKLKPEICFVIGWYWLLSKSTLNLVKYGFLGLHNSILPKYRGGSPLIWALINGEKKVGISLFSFTERVDDGEIWAKSKIVNNNEYVQDILEKFENAAELLFEKYYLKILKHQIKPKAQNDKHSLYCSPRFPGDGIIDWNSSAKDLNNFIRAQSKPYPGAFTFLNRNKMIIWKSNIILSQKFIGKPGQVLKINKNTVWVCCKDIFPLEIEEVEINNQVLKPSSIIKSYKIRLSDNPNFKSV